MHQYTSSHFMPGIYNEKGQPVGVDANMIPLAYEDIVAQLGVNIEEPEVPNPFEDTFNRGWNERGEEMIKYLKETGKGAN